MQTVSTEQLVGQTVGHYNVKSLLGRGRLSAVYLAQHPAQNHAAALTAFIVPERFTAETRTRFTQRFMREAAALTALSHRNLLPIHEYGEQFGYPYLITPYMTNGSLADILKRQGRCTPAYALEVLEQVAAGLEYAHRKGIVHGTLKPANVLLNTDQNLLVAGFGLVHMLQIRGLEQNDQPYSYLLSIADTFLYASTYIAPEVVQGQPIDSRSDIYALGIMLFELLSGKPPFTGTSPLDTAIQHLQHPLPSLHQLSLDIPIAMELVINHALARDPGQRFQRVSELVEAFSQVCKGSANRSQSILSSGATVLPDAPKSSNNLQSVPEEEVSIGSWQLAPPIITGKFSAIHTSAKNTVPSTQATPAKSLPITTDSWQILPPIVTGHLTAVKPAQQMPTAKPVVQPPTIPQSSTTSLQQFAAAQNKVSPQLQRPSHQLGQGAPIAQSPQPLLSERAGNDTDAMNTPAWWIQGSPPLASVPLARAPEASLGLSNLEQRRPVEQNKQVPPPDTVMHIRPPKRARNMGRRTAIATIAAGGVVAAGALIAGKMNLTHLAMPLTAHTGQGTTTTPDQPKPTANRGQQSPTTHSATPTMSGNPGKTGMGPTGRVLGTTSIPTNTSTDIVNPADGKAGLLIHLPNGHFAAYERACTHEQVEVNYDPMTHTLVCPAHGSVFDPLNNAAVLQGPAMRPLKSVAFHVNADGTITAG